MTATIVSFPTNRIRRRINTFMPMTTLAPTAAPPARFTKSQRVQEKNGGRKGTVYDTDLGTDCYRVKFDGDSFAIVNGEHVAPLYPEPNPPAAGHAPRSPGKGEPMTTSMPTPRPHYRQGDILLLPIDRTVHDLNKVPREDGRLILAHGKSTGHSHAVLGFDSRLFDDGDGLRLLAVKEADDVIHDEHGTVPIHGDTYEVLRQFESRRKALTPVED